MNRPPKECLTLPESIGPVDALAFSADGKLLAASYAGKLLVLWDLETGAPAYTTSLKDKVTSIAFASAETICLSGPFSFAYWQYKQEKQSQSYFPDYGGELNVVSANGKAHAHIGYPSEDSDHNFLFVHQGPNITGFPGKLFDLPEFFIEFLSLCLSGDGNKVAASWWVHGYMQENQECIVILDVASSSIDWWDSVLAKVHSLSYSGRYLAYEYSEETLWIEDILDRNIVYDHRDCSARINGVDFSADERSVAIITEDAVLTLVSLPEGEIIYQIKLDFEPSAVRFSGGEEWLAVGDNTGRIDLFRTCELLGLS